MLEDPQAVKDAIANAADLDVPYIGLGTLPLALRESADGFRTYAANLNKIAKEVSKEGCKLLYHPHAVECFSLGGGLKGLDILMDETDPQGVSFTLDTHWLASGGVDLLYYIRKGQGRMTNIHFKDYAIVPGAGEDIGAVFKQFAEIGEGNINWPPVIKLCKEIGIEYVLVEQDWCKHDPFESLEISIRNMNRFGGF